VIADKERPVLIIRLAGSPPGTSPVFGALDLREVPLLSGVAIPNLWTISILSPRTGSLRARPRA
jgi:hypothetical protein